jgi:hypothetical protein
MFSCQPEKKSKRFWRFIRKKFLKNKLNESGYMIYVTSDSQLATEEAREYFGPHKVVSFEDSNFHFELDFDSRANNRPRVRKTVLDFHLLRECDMTVTSHSGFSLLGLWNRPNPSKDLFAYTTYGHVRHGRFSCRNLKFIKLDQLGEFFFSM